MRKYLVPSSFAPATADLLQASCWTPCSAAVLRGKQGRPGNCRARRRCPTQAPESSCVRVDRRANLWHRPEGLSPRLSRENAYARSAFSAMRLPGRCMKWAKASPAFAIERPRRSAQFRTLATCLLLLSARTSRTFATICCSTTAPTPNTSAFRRASWQKNTLHVPEEYAARARRADRAARVRHARAGAV